MRRIFGQWVLPPMPRRESSAELRRPENQMPSIGPGCAASRRMFDNGRRRWPRTYCLAADESNPQRTGSLRRGQKWFAAGMRSAPHWRTRGDRSWRQRFAAYPSKCRYPVQSANGSLRGCWTDCRRTTGLNARVYRERVPTQNVRDRGRVCSRLGSPYLCR